MTHQACAVVYYSNMKRKHYFCQNYWPENRLRMLACMWVMLLDKWTQSFSRQACADYCADTTTTPVHVVRKHWHEVWHDSKSPSTGVVRIHHTYSIKYVNIFPCNCQTPMSTLVVKVVLVLIKAVNICNPREGEDAPLISGLWCFWCGQELLTPRDNNVSPLLFTWIKHIGSKDTLITEGTNKRKLFLHVKYSHSLLCRWLCTSRNDWVKNIMLLRTSTITHTHSCGEHLEAWSKPDQNWAPQA